MVRGNKTRRGGLGKQAPYRTGGRLLSSIHCRFIWAHLEVPSRVLRHFARTQVQSAVLEVHRPTTDGEGKRTRTIRSCFPVGKPTAPPLPPQPLSKLRMFELSPGCKSHSSGKCTTRGDPLRYSPCGQSLSLGPRETRG